MSSTRSYPPRGVPHPASSPHAHTLTSPGVRRDRHVRRTAGKYDCKHNVLKTSGYSIFYIFKTSVLSLFFLTLGFHRASLHSHSHCHCHSHLPLPLSCSHFHASRMARRSSQSATAPVGILSAVYSRVRRRSGHRCPRCHSDYLFPHCAPQRHHPAQEPPRVAMLAPLRDVRSTL